MSALLNLEILVFRCSIVAVSVLLGGGATSLGIFRPTFRRSLLVPSYKDEMFNLIEKLESYFLYSHFFVSCLPGPSLIAGRSDTGDLAKCHEGFLKCNINILKHRISFIFTLDYNDI